MKRVLASIISVTITIILIASPLTTYADTYGSGSYGEGVYGAQSTSNTNPVSSAITSVGNTISAFFCTNQPPSSAPNLYEIDSTSTTATLFFAPAAGPDDNYYISYGQGNANEGYGIQISTSQPSGALFYKIMELSPSTVYTFKVRGGNGCKPGPWSNTLTIQTLSSQSRVTKKFYPDNQVQYIQAKPASWIARAQAYVNNLLPGVPNTGLAPAKQHIKATEQTKNVGQKSSNSLLGKITNFFSGIFRGL